MRNILVAFLLVAVLFSGCTGQSAVSNHTNHFSYAGQAADKDTLESYTWENTMGRADVDWAGQVGKGTIILTISDAAGNQVFSRGIDEGRQEAFEGSTSAGVAGDWTIKFTFSDYTGQIALDIQAKPGSNGGDLPWP